MKSGRIVIVTAVLALCFCARTYSGALNPPPGPIQPTNRVQLNAQSITLPYTITQPGSYVFTSNLTGVAGQDGIIIDADDVTLDLNGFTLRGVSGSGAGILVNGVRTGLVIHDGVIRNWGGVGLEGSTSLGMRVRGVTALESSRGISVGQSAVVESSIANANSSDGFTMQGGATMRQCVASNNLQNGFQGLENVVLIECVAQSNQSASFSDGFDVEQGSILRDCTAEGNSGSGLRLRGNCVASGCVSRTNTMHGIDASEGHARIVDCVGSSNLQDGIHALYGSHVSNCIADRNDGDGIELGSDSIALGNSCSENIQAGIRANNDDNRIEGNKVSDNDLGIALDASGNLAVRNTATGNASSDYQFSAGNAYGPIVNVTGVGDISGSADHPWTNFVY